MTRQNKSGDQAIAEEEIRTTFVVDAKTFEKFTAMLDRPAKPNARLEKTLQTPAPWDTLSLPPD